MQEKAHTLHAAAVIFRWSSRAVQWIASLKPQIPKVEFTRLHRRGLVLFRMHMTPLTALA